ncbi:histidine phosphatase family protein [Ectobacillus sp. JY-23]|uniref:histidine phosphatase family protein n=1 Tax=Ectobacillus sp. JY-23 TaxID=2933872 RepID=UPI001FF6B3E6|nr:histidine phosphatase family protein [Ectobacillus sp. JY-23]UOY92254.1 histidine phosphatase family protein [Ectobacillus sp. JY-23]
MIYIVRHGQTDFNVERKMQGKNGLPLNETGVAQAEALRQELREIPFQYVFSSPQERAVQTAALITGKTVQTDPRLDVFDLGEADGLPIDEVKRKGAMFDAEAYPSMEKPEAFAKRIFSFMREIEETYGHDVPILIAGHRCTTGCMGAYFHGLPEDGNILRFSSDNGRYKVYEFTGGAR